MSRFTQADLRKSILNWNEDARPHGYEFQMQNSYNLTSLLLNTLRSDGPSSNIKTILIGSPRECWQAGGRVLGDILDNAVIDNTLFKIKLAVEALDAGQKWKAREFLVASFDELGAVKKSI